MKNKLGFQASQALLTCTCISPVLPIHACTRYTVSLFAAAIICLSPVCLSSNKLGWAIISTCIKHEFFHCLRPQTFKALRFLGKYSLILFHIVQLCFHPELADKKNAFIFLSIPGKQASRAFLSPCLCALSDVLNLSVAKWNIWAFPASFFLPSVYVRPSRFGLYLKDSGALVVSRKKSRDVQ